MVGWHHWLNRHEFEQALGDDEGQGSLACYSLSSVQFSHSVVSDSLRPHESQHARPPCPHKLPEFTQTHVHRVGDAIQQSYPHHPLLLLPSIFPSIRDFSSESVLHIRWPKCWNFSFSNSPSNEYSVTPQETEPDLPVSVQESLAEVWLDSGLPQSQGH